MDMFTFPRPESWLKMSGTNHPVMPCHIPQQTSHAPVWKSKKLNNQTYWLLFQATVNNAKAGKLL
jgi:hypothetical protein